MRMVLCAIIDDLLIAHMLLYNVVHAFNYVNWNLVKFVHNL
jgi:hypothetical protein